MKKLFPLFLVFAFLFVACNQNPQNAAETGTVSLSFGSERSVITPYELTEATIDAITQWKITFTDSYNDQTIFNITDRSNYDLIVPTGTYSVEATASVTTADNVILNITGTTENVVVQKGKNTTCIINVSYQKEGKGSLILSVDCSAFINQDGTGLTNLSAQLKPKDNSETIIPLTLTLTNNIAAISGENITAGFYDLSLIYTSEDDFKYNVLLKDSIVRIFGDVQTVGETIAYNNLEVDLYITSVEPVEGEDGNGFTEYTPISLSGLFNKLAAIPETMKARVICDNPPILSPYATQIEKLTNKVVSFVVNDNDDYVLVRKIEYGSLVSAINKIYVGSIDSTVTPADSNDGFIDSPVKTLQKAVDIAVLRNNTEVSSFEIILRDDIQVADELDGYKTDESSKRCIAKIAPNAPISITVIGNNESTSVPPEPVEIDGNGKTIRVFNLDYSGITGETGINFTLKDVVIQNIGTSTTDGSTGDPLSISTNHILIHETSDSTKTFGNTVTIENCKISDSYTSGDCGVLSKLDISVLKVIGTTFSSINNYTIGDGNQCVNGGVIYIGSGTAKDSLLFQECTFNYLLINGGSGVTSWAPNGNGGSGAVAMCSGPVTFKGCTFTNNTSQGAGGCLSVIDEKSDVLIEGCTFTGNQSADYTGHCIYQKNGTVQITGSTLTPVGSGCVIDYEGGTLTIDGTQQTQLGEF